MLVFLPRLIFLLLFLSHSYCLFLCFHFLLWPWLFLVLCSELIVCRRWQTVILYFYTYFVFFVYYYYYFCFLMIFLKQRWTRIENLAKELMIFKRKNTTSIFLGVTRNILSLRFWRTAYCIFFNEIWTGQNL